MSHGVSCDMWQEVLENTDNWQSIARKQSGVKHRSQSQCRLHMVVDYWAFSSLSPCAEAIFHLNPRGRIVVSPQKKDDKLPTHLFVFGVNPKIRGCSWFLPFHLGSSEVNARTGGKAKTPSSPVTKMGNGSKSQMAKRQSQISTTQKYSTTQPKSWFFKILSKQCCQIAYLKYRTNLEFPDTQ